MFKSVAYTGASRPAITPSTRSVQICVHIQMVMPPLHHSEAYAQVDLPGLGVGSVESRSPFLVGHPSYLKTKIGA